MGRGWDGELPAHPGSPPGPLPSLGQQPSSSPRAWGGVFLLFFLWSGNVAVNDTRPIK